MGKKMQMNMSRNKTFELEKIENRDGGRKGEDYG